MPQETVFKLNIYNDGQVEVQRESANNGIWNCVLSPGQFDEARAILPDYEYGLIQAVWTQEIIAAYQEAMTNKPGIVA